MKIVGFIPYSVVDWPGKVCATIFLPGCNFQCGWCNNPDVVLNKTGKIIPLKKVIDTIKENKDWYDGICITGGEPTIHKDLCLLLKEFKKNNIKIKLDTNGSNFVPLWKLVRNGFVDFVAMDIKSDPENYQKTCGVNFPKDIFSSVDFLYDNNVPYEFRTTVIPGIHTEEMIENIGKWLKGAQKFAIQNFWGQGNHLNPKYNQMNPFRRDQLERFKYLLKSYIYNVEIRNIVY